MLSKFGIRINLSLIVVEGVFLQVNHEAHHLPKFRFLNFSRHLTFRMTIIYQNISSIHKKDQKQVREKNIS